MPVSRFVILCFILILGRDLRAQAGQTYWNEKEWGIGMATRVATIPFYTDDKNTVSSLIPHIFYSSKNFFFTGTGGGLMLYTDENQRFSLIGRMHFFDIPEIYQNQIQGDGVDWGLQYRLYSTEGYFLDLETMSDWNRNFHSNLRIGTDIRTGRIVWITFAELKFKSAEYNSWFYGLQQEPLSPGIEYALGMRLYLQVISNMYLFSSIKFTHLDRPAYSAEYVEKRSLAELYLGFGFSNNRLKKENRKLENSPYLRVAHGLATPTDLMDILTLHSVPDSFNNRMSSVFYGYPLTDRLFGLPVQLYIVSGFVWHWPSVVQSDAQEVVLAVKFDFTVPWPIRWRVGFAEGLSYINNITYIERQEIDRKDLEYSNLLNYLDYTLDLNLGDIFGSEFLGHLWLGYSLHHRSGIFGTAQQFGRINGGSNYNSLYLQWHW